MMSPRAAIGYLAVTGCLLAASVPSGRNSGRGSVADAVICRRLHGCFHLHCSKAPTRLDRPGLAGGHAGQLLWCGVCAAQFRLEQRRRVRRMRDRLRSDRRVRHLDLAGSGGSDFVGIARGEPCPHSRARMLRSVTFYLDERAAPRPPEPPATSDMPVQLALLERAVSEGASAHRRAVLLAAITVVERLHVRADRLDIVAREERVARRERDGAAGNRSGARRDCRRLGRTRA